MKDLKNETESFAVKFLKSIYVFQEKTYKIPLNRPVKLRRMNPFNPMSYIIWPIMVVLFILREIARDIITIIVELQNPFKWD
jgi:hypothetical protein